MINVKMDTVDKLINIAEDLKQIKKDTKGLEVIEIYVAEDLTKIIVGDAIRELHITDEDRTGYKVAVPKVFEVNG